MSENATLPDGTAPHADADGREWFFDNAKFLLIWMVVTGHLISPLKTGNPVLFRIWVTVNALHMPCFVFLSGFFAKSYIKDGIVKTKRLFTYLVHYLWAQLLVMVGECLITGKGFSLNLLAPRGMMWFLMCLVAWYAVLPYLYRFRPAILLSGALFAALAAGYAANAGGPRMRLISYFPFFLAGWCFRKDWLFRFRHLPVQCAAVAVAGVVVWMMALLPAVYTGKVLSGAYSYLACRADKLFPAPLWFVPRLAWYAAAVLLGASFLLLVPRRRMFFTGFGARTLQVYILHQFVYLIETQCNLRAYFSFPGGGVLMLLIAAAVTVLLSLRVFGYPFDWIGKLDFSFLQGEPPTRM